LAAWTTDATHFFLNREDTKSFVNDYKLFKGRAFLILTITQPGEAIGDFTIPGCIIFPVYFFNVLNCVESKVDTQGHLKALRMISIDTCRVWEPRANKR
jgi:hypothetical protein